MINISNLGMIDAQLITILYLYGQQNPQSNYNDNIRPSDATNPTITIDMYAYMTQGPGLYATRYATSERSVAFGALLKSKDNMLVILFILVMRFGLKTVH